MTTEDRKREIFAQPSAAKEVYAPEDHYINSIIGIVRGPDGLWHLIYEPAYPRGPLGLPSAGKSSSFDHATSKDLLTWTHHGPVVEAGGPGDCDAYEVGDGCIIQHEGRWHMVYHARPYLGASRRFAWPCPMTCGAGLSTRGTARPSSFPTACYLAGGKRG